MLLLFKLINIEMSDCITTTMLFKTGISKIPLETPTWQQVVKVVA